MNSKLLAVFPLMLAVALAILVGTNPVQAVGEEGRDVETQYVRNDAICAGMNAVYEQCYSCCVSNGYTGNDTSFAVGIRCRCYKEGTTKVNSSDQPDICYKWEPIK